MFHLHQTPHQRQLSSYTTNSGTDWNTSQSHTYFLLLGLTILLTAAGCFIPLVCFFALISGSENVLISHAHGQLIVEQTRKWHHWSWTAFCNGTKTSDIMLLRIIVLRTYLTLTFSILLQHLKQMKMWIERLVYSL